MVVILNPNSFYWDEESGVVENNLKNCLLWGLGALHSRFLGGQKKSRNDIEGLFQQSLYHYSELLIYLNRYHFAI